MVMMDSQEWIPRPGKIACLTPIGRTLAHKTAETRFIFTRASARFIFTLRYSQTFSTILILTFSNIFNDILKYTDITTAFKKGDTTDKTNHRSIRTLPNLSKVFEKIIYAQINSFMEPKLSKYLTRFREKHNTQHD